MVLEVTRSTGLGFGSLAMTMKTWSGLKLDNSETLKLTPSLENLLENGGELLIEGHPNALKCYLKDEVVVSYKYTGSIGAFVAASNDAIGVVEKLTKKGRLLALTSAITSSIDSHKQWGLAPITVGGSSSICDSSTARNTATQPFTPAVMKDGPQSVNLQSITAMEEYKNMYAHRHHHYHHHYHHSHHHHHYYHYHHHYYHHHHHHCHHHYLITILLVLLLSLSPSQGVMKSCDFKSTRKRPRLIVLLLLLLLLLRMLPI